MDINELVRTIAQEVMKQLAGEPEKECVMILDNRDCAAVAPVLEHLGNGVEPLYLNEEAKEKTPIRYILPTLSIGRMADLAAGRTSDPLVEEVLRLLLEGNQVEVFEFEYKSYADTAPSALYGLYESYEKSLASFGVTVFAIKQPDTVNLKKRLVTEKDVIQAQEEGAAVLRIPVNATVTPLAVESARNLNIELLKR